MLLQPLTRTSQMDKQAHRLIQREHSIGLASPKQAPGFQVDVANEASVFGHRLTFQPQCLRVSTQTRCVLSPIRLQISRLIRRDQTKTHRVCPSGELYRNLPNNPYATALFSTTSPKWGIFDEVRDKVCGKGPGRRRLGTGVVLGVDLRTLLPGRIFSLLQSLPTL